MNVDLYERIWMWGVAAMLVLFFSTTAVAALGHHMQPPSHIETIDPKTVMKDPRFAPAGVAVGPNGQVDVRIVGLTFAWLPADFTVPAETPITFHLTSLDVIHGFEIVRTNGQTMVVPGYVSQFTTRFVEPGEYLIACNEYCGVGHHMMAAKMKVVPRAEWQAPVPAPVALVGPITESEHAHAR
jgi:cytochrome c oxidase subunit II